MSSWVIGAPLPAVACIPFLKYSRPTAAWHGRSAEEKEEVEPFLEGAQLFKLCYEVSQTTIAAYGDRATQGWSNFVLW